MRPTTTCVSVYNVMLCSLQAMPGTQKETPSQNDKCTGLFFMCITEHSGHGAFRPIKLGEIVMACTLSLGTHLR